MAAKISRRFGHSAGSEFAAGHGALVRPDENHAICRAGASRFRCVAGWVNMRQFIAGAASAVLSDASNSVEARSLAMALRRLGEEIGGGRGDDDEVGLPAQFDVAHFRFIGQREQILIDLVAAQAGERKRRDELCAGLGENHPHLHFAARNRRISSRLL